MLNEDYPSVIKGSAIRLHFRDKFLCKVPLSLAPLELRQLFGTHRDIWFPLQEASEAIPWPDLLT